MTQKSLKGLAFRWPTLKGAVALILFTVSAILIECLIVAYAVNIGVQDDANFQIPWLGLTVSPLFHMVPISTVIVLVASWSCMVKYAAMKTPEKAKAPSKKEKLSERRETGKSGFWGKVKAELLKFERITHAGDRMGFAKVTVKSAVTILLVFLALALLISVLANPWLVYAAFANLYQNNPQILGFVTAINNALKGFTEAVAPLGWLCSSIDGTIKASASSFRSFHSALGALIKPLADLPPAGKYLVFQNLAAWFSSLAVLGYGAYVRKSYRRKRK